MASLPSSPRCSMSMATQATSTWRIVDELPFLNLQLQHVAGACGVPSCPPVRCSQVAQPSPDVKFISGYLSAMGDRNLVGGPFCSELTGQSPSSLLSHPLRAKCSPG